MPQDPNVIATAPVAGSAVPGDDATMDEAMTPQQKDMMRALCEETGQPMNTTLTRRQADARLEELREMSRKD